MQKRLFIVHGWGGNSNQPMLKQLEEMGNTLGFETTVVDMPHADVPTIDSWIKHLDSVVMYPDENTYFVGHSLGCQAILRYIQSAESPQTGGVICIAPAFFIADLETAEDKDIARPWIDNPINFPHLKKVILESVGIFSDNDLTTPLIQNEEIFRKLSDKIIIEQSKGHFTQEDGVVDLPSACSELERMSKNP
ncbi:MAG: alpha/beta hydrolase [bacterium]|nr:alpha/beta hydrolase [bacterium]